MSRWVAYRHGVTVRELRTVTTGAGVGLLGPFVSTAEGGLRSLTAIPKPRGLPFKEERGCLGVEIVHLSPSFPVSWRYNMGKVKQLPTMKTGG